jgi:hypothetical protein
MNLESWSGYGDAGVTLLSLQGNVGIQLNFTNYLGPAPPYTV